MATTLFDKYGGFASVSKVVMSFYDKVLESDIIGPYFDEVDMRRLIDHQTKFIASVMGGPASFSDDMLARVHARFAIDRPAFDEMARLLRATLEEYEVQADDVETIMGQIEAKAHYVIAGSHG